MSYRNKVQERCNEFELSSVIILLISFAMMTVSLISPTHFLQIWILFSIMNASLHYIKTGSWSANHIF